MQINISDLENRSDEFCPKDLDISANFGDCWCTVQANDVPMLIKALRVLQAKIWELKHNCKHFVPVQKMDSYKEYGSASCSTCETRLGWYCPDNPEHYCVYDDNNDPCHDNCTFCHEPEERK